MRRRPTSGRRRKPAACAGPGAAGAEVAAGAQLAAGRFVTGVEVLPPRGHDATEAVAAARALRDHAAWTWCSVPDAPRGGARLSALSLAALITAGRHRDAAPVLLPRPQPARHPVGPAGRARDGLRNLLGITGDVAQLGDYPDATAVFDVDSIGLTNVVSRLNHGLDIGGQPIGAPTRVPYRGDGQPVAGPRPGAQAPGIQGRGRGRVRGDAAGLRRRRLRAVPSACRGVPDPDHRRDCGRSKVP